MALGDARRASGQAMEQARRASGQAMEDARRNAGRQMEASRRGEAVVEDINSIVQPRRLRSSLPRLQPVGAIPAQRSRADYKPPASAGAAGIASPLTEQTKTIDENGQPKQVADRVYYAPETILSPDGLITFRVRPLQTLSMTDANGAEVIFEFAQP